MTPALLERARLFYDGGVTPITLCASGRFLSGIPVMRAELLDILQIIRYLECAVIIGTYLRKSMPSYKYDSAAHVKMGCDEIGA